MTHEKILFTPLEIKSLEFKNRIWVAPMCQYSSDNGHPTDWHFVHLGSRAVGGAGFVMVEATAVSPEGRITSQDSGIWSDDHIASFKPLTNFIKSQGALCGIQLAHSGRKGSAALPWLGGKILSESEQGWQTVAPSPIPFESGDPIPQEMTQDDMAKTIHDFENATLRSLKAGFQVLELHMAHGYLIHEFLSPISNQRKDEYGGSFENRIRFPLEIVKAVRNKWPSELPLFVRISATDWADGPVELKAISENRPSDTQSWDVFESILFCCKLKELGIDLIDCSSSGILPNPQIPLGPGYQVPFSDVIRRESKIMTAAVGLITEPIQAEAILFEQKADAIFMAREFLRNPYWPIQAARSFDLKLQKPKQYARA